MVTATAAHKTALRDQRRIVPIKNEGGQSTRQDARDPQNETAAELAAMSKADAENSAFRRSARSVRFIFAISGSGVRDFECALSSRRSSFVHGAP